MKKRLLSILLVAAMVVAMVPAMVFATSAEATVTDWEAEEIVLMNADDYLAFHAQLIAGNSFKGQTVKLGADIDLGGVTLDQIGSGVTSTNGFRGTLDGQFHTLQNFKTPAQYSNGFLGNLYTADPDVHVQIKNLRVLNYTNTVSKRVGAFYGQVGVKLTFENVYLNAYINGTAGNSAEYAGGYIGNIVDAADVQFKNCVFDGTVAMASNNLSGSGYVGAVGHKDGVDGGEAPDNPVVFENCVVTGTFYYASAGETTNPPCRFIGCWGVNNSAAGKEHIDIVDGVTVYKNCLQWNEYFQNNTGTYRAICEELTGMWPGGNTDTVLAKLPADGSFTARSTSYPIPTTLLPFFSADFINWEEETITLTNADDFKAFHNQLVAGKDFKGQTVKLGADIDLAGATLAQIGNALTSTNGFRGTLDGQFHTLSNFKTPAQLGNGFLGNLTAADPDVHVQIKNLAVVNYTNTVSKRVGAFYGQVNVKLTFENVYLNAYLNGTSGNSSEYAGGYIGNVIDSADVLFKNCVFDGTVAFASNNTAGSGFVGAVGHKDSGYDRPDNPLTFENCVVTGTFYYASAGDTTNASCRFIGLWGANNGDTNSAHADVVDGVTEYTNCLQWNEYYQTNTSKYQAVCTGMTGMWPGGLSINVPESFTARNESYPVPTTLLPFFTEEINAAHTTQAGAAELVVEYSTAQEKYENGELSVRLIGAMNLEEGKTLADYTAIGFEVVAIRQENGELWNNGATEITNVYTSYLNNEETVTAEAAGGDYVFVYALDGIQPNKGIVTFAIKTFYVDAEGETTYTDMYVLDYDTAYTVA